MSCRHADFPHLDLCPKPYTEPVEGLIAGLTILFILIVCGLLVFAFRVLKKDRGAVKGTFMFLVFMSAAWPLHETESSCLAKPVFHVLGFSLMVGMLGARIYKLWFLFIYSPKLRLNRIIELNNLFLTRVDTLIVLGIIFVVELILCTLLYSVDDYRPTCECRNYSDQSNPAELYYSTCTVSKDFQTIAFLVNLIPCLIIFYLAFVTSRKFQKDGEILGIPKKEVFAFWVILRAMLVIFVLVSVASIMTYTQSNNIKTNLQNRKLYYGFRSCILIIAAVVPVFVLFSYRRDRYIERKNRVTTRMSSGIRFSMRKLSTENRSDVQTTTQTAASKKSKLETAETSNKFPTHDLKTATSLQIA